jgi:hypothetical protein
MQVSKIEYYQPLRGVPAVDAAFILKNKTTFFHCGTAVKTEAGERCSNLVLCA